MILLIFNVINNIIIIIIKFSYDTNEQLLNNKIHFDKHDIDLFNG